MEKNIYQRLFDAKKEIGKISKDSTNPFYKSKYFDINQLLEHVEPVLQKHGLLLLQPIEDDKVFSIIYDIASDGFIKSCISLTEMNDPQKKGSEITYYRRYTLQSLLGLQAEDDDANATVSKATPPADNKKWLNQYTSAKKDAVTKEWQNIVVAVENGKITNIDDIRKVYKVSKAIQTQLETLLN